MEESDDSILDDFINKRRLEFRSKLSKNCSPTRGY